MPIILPPSSCAAEAISFMTPRSEPPHISVCLCAASRRANSADGSAYFSAISFAEQKTQIFIMAVYQRTERPELIGALELWHARAAVREEPSYRTRNATSS